MACSGQFGQQRRQAVRDHADCNSRQDHAHEVAHNHPRVGQKTFSQHLGVPECHQQQRHDSQKYTRVSNVFNRSYDVLHLGDQRGDRLGAEQYREGQRTEIRRFGCRVGLHFPVSYAVQTALIPVQHIQACHQDVQSASDIQIIDTDAEQSKRVTANSSKRSARKQSVDRCFHGHFALICSAWNPGHAQEHGQIGDRNQGTERFDGKVGLQRGNLVSARNGRKPVPSSNNMNEAA